IDRQFLAGRFRFGLNGDSKQLVCANQNGLKLQASKLICAQQLSNLIIRAKAINGKLVGPEGDADAPLFARLVDRRSFERPFENFDEIIASEETAEHGDASGGEAFDEHPAK